MRRRAIVLANGYIEDAALIRARLGAWTDALVIAADGGSKHAGTLGLDIDAVVGDLDSLDATLRAGSGASRWHIEESSPHKDETDLELALLYAAGQGAEHIAVLAALGGRLDMTLANILVLAHPRLEAVRVELWSGDQTAWLIRPPGGEINGQRGDTVSLIPLGGDATSIVTEGLEYPLRGEALVFGLARGVSNILAGPAARVKLRAGLLLAVHTPRRA